MAPPSVPKRMAEGTVRTAPALGLTPGTRHRPPPAATLQPLTGVVRPLDADRARQGLLFGPAINVYLSNNVALIQGAVGTPRDSTAGNRPGSRAEVQRIDNRLVALGCVQATAGIPAEGKTKIIRAAGSREPAAPGASTRQARTRASPGRGNKYFRSPRPIINPARNKADPQLARSAARSLRFRPAIAKP